MESENVKKESRLDFFVRKSDKRITILLVSDESYKSKLGHLWNSQVKEGALECNYKAVLSEGRFGLTKYDNIGTFEQIVRPKYPSGNCLVNCFLTDRTALKYYGTVVIS